MINNQFLKNVNLLKNPGFEAGDNSWSGSTPAWFTVTKDAAHVGLGVASGVFTPTAAGHFQSILYDVPNALKGEKGTVGINYKGGAAGIYTLQVLSDVDAVLFSRVLPVSADYVSRFYDFKLPTSGQIKIRISASAAGAAIYLDQFWLGTDDNQPSDGLKNYLKNGTFAEDIFGWTDGVDDSSLSHNTTTQISGPGSLNYTTQGAARNIDGSLDDFDTVDIDSVQYAVIWIQRPATATAGAYKVQWYNTTDGAVEEEQTIEIGTFSYALPVIKKTGKSYVLRITDNGGDAAGQVFQIAQGRVGPDAGLVSPVLTDWFSYTPAIAGWDGSSSLNCEWRQSGNSIEISGDFVAGTYPASTTEVRIPLPNGYVISSKNTSNIKVGLYQAAQANSNLYWLLAKNGDNYVTVGRFADGSALNNLISVTSTAVGASVRMAFRSDPIKVVGLAGTTRIASNETQYNSARVKLYGHNVTAANATIGWKTIAYNDGDGFTIGGSAGAYTTLTAKFSGYCRAAFSCGGSGLRFSCYRNVLASTNTIVIADFVSSHATGSSDFYMNEGDIIWVSPNTSSDTVDSAIESNFFSISRIADDTTRIATGIKEVSATTWGFLPAGSSYIEETGSNSNGDYVKFSDGTMICRHRATYTTAVSSAFGGVYISPLQSWTYPVAFVGGTPQALQATGPESADGAFILGGAAPGTALTASTFFLCRGSSTASTNYNMSLYAIGKWK